MDQQTQTEIEAAAFRRLLEHLDSRKDAQNIDLMNLAGFCRNCLSKWYRSAAQDRGVEMDYDQAREVIYKEPYTSWKDKYQQPASAEQRAAFEKAFAKTNKEK
ncbi:alkaline phosphatase ['Osedax' symbiont bacterium Rs2_46_30_T18]|nr:alkaline phosphatase ['Osedax' symbiont bacterium Rs2_46_30_T18]